MQEDLVDEVPDVLLDDDEYFARHPEDEDSDGDDGNDDGGDDAESESNSEEAEPMKTEIEVVEPTVVEEPIEVASGIEEDVVEIPRDVSVQYVRKKKKTVEKPEEIDVLQIAQTVMAEAESIAQIDEVDAGITDPITDDITTALPQTAENIGQGQIESIQSGSVAETEVFEVTESEKEAGSEDTVQFEPIQAEAVEVESAPEIEAEVASQFEPVQTDDAPMIEALDDLDIDWTESEDEAEPEPVQNTVEELPDDLDQRSESGLT
ncbi:hypothetical protein QVD17_07876 [Tagetes erecta]|uniref:Uncharacterized protein n=1 Tax=Tagetes erecta TaxID=13708 RepID=A0AAD8P494_TARER|nr:hypothetical protein QVD17_07876 [Tagetes erecta]